MLIHVVRHVPFEGPGLIAEWATLRGHVLTESSAVTEDYPAIEEFDFVVVMGGPMAADDDRGHPWLLAEKRYLAAAIESKRLVLGVCLGAQILADAAGGSVRRSAHREIGWFPVRRTGHADSQPVFASFPDGLVVGHWHADTFTLPPGIAPALSSAANENQAFSLENGRVVGLQFHLEWTRRSVDELIRYAGEDLVLPGPYVATAQEMAAGAERHAATSRAALFDLLDTMTVNAEEAR